MNSATRRVLLAGPAGALEAAIDEPAAVPAAGLALLCHPHPLHGGTMDNKVVQTIARAFLQCGWRAARFNFRGVGRSEGGWDEGRGEVDDALAVLEGILGQDGSPRPSALAIGGFSFGGYVASELARRLPMGTPLSAQILVAPAVVSFETPPSVSGALVVQGEADDVVPLAAVLEWARPPGQPVTVVPGVGHFFHGQLPLLRQLVVHHLRGLGVARLEA